jgi:hypothetical protein
MQTYFLAAAIVITFVGIIHSVFGEILIFRKLRKSGFIPKESAPPLQARNVRILWASWHLASAFGFGFAGILLSISNSNSRPDQTIISALLFAFLAGSALVFIATKGKHPGWIGLLTVAVLVHLGSIQQ